MKKFLTFFLFASIALNTLFPVNVFAENSTNSVDFEVPNVESASALENSPEDKEDETLLIVRIFRNEEEKNKKILYELKEELIKRGYPLEDIESFHFSYDFEETEEEIYPVIVKIFEDEELTKEIEEVKCVFYLSEEQLPEIYIKDFFIEVENGDKINFEDNIESINTDKEFLKIKGDVDFNSDGEYVVYYVLGDGFGNKDESQLTISVKTSEETIENRYVAADAAIQKNRDEAERRAAKKREEKRIAEQQARQAELVAAGLYTDSVNPRFGNGNNPYPGTYWNNCTWSAWQLMHDIRGIDMPAWGDAGNWLKNAQRDGWATGSEPQTGSIIVMSGHVAYVAEVSEDGTRIFIREGNIKGKYNEGWVSAYGPIHGQYVKGYIYP